MRFDFVQSAPVKNLHKATLPVLGLLLWSTGCQQTSTDPKLGYIHPGQAYELSSRQREKLEMRATAGDADAAFRLAEFYHHFAHDKTQGHFWMQWAAEKGHVTAQNNLAMSLWLDPARRMEAVQWLEKAAATGDQLARRRLDQIEQTGRL